MCGAENGIKFQRFSGKDDTKAEFLGFEGPSNSEVEEKIEVLEENRDGINLRLTGSRAHGQSAFFGAWRSRGQKCFSIRISFSYQKNSEVTALSLLNLDPLSTESQV